MKKAVWGLWEVARRGWFWIQLRWRLWSVPSRWASFGRRGSQDLREKLTLDQEILCRGMLEELNKHMRGKASDKKVINL